MIVLFLYIIFSLIITIYCLNLTYKSKLISGPKGLNGEEGSKGIQGIKGNKGSTGIKGEKGGKGPPGKPGARRGLQGVAGNDGNQGPQGLRGFRGFRGEDGDDGERGVIGNIGRSGISGSDGPPGKPGDYLYIDIDYDSCKSYNFDGFTREMKCGGYEVLVEINNDVNNYSGKCCKLKMSDKCINERAGTYLDKDLTSEELELKNKYDERFPESKGLYHKYKCDDGYTGKPQGDVYRCCRKEEEINLNYNKDY